MLYSMLLCISAQGVLFRDLYSREVILYYKPTTATTLRMRLIKQSVLKNKFNIDLVGALTEGEGIEKIREHTQSMVLGFSR